MKTKEMPVDDGLNTKFLFDGTNVDSIEDPRLKVPPALNDIEQYRSQMAVISTATFGYWKEGDGIHPAYDTIVLRDVAKLYAKYDAAVQRQWVGLTDGDIDEVWCRLHDALCLDYKVLSREIEAKLKAKNT